MKADSICAVEHAWSKHHDLVKWHTWRIIKRYGGDFDELFSEALVLFTQAVQSYEPILGELPNWIGYSVWHGLLEIKRTEARRLNITGAVGSDLTGVHKQEGGLSSLWRDLSTEAQDLLGVLFDMDVSMYKNKSLAKCKWRQVMREDHGWDNQKISRCFREIEEAL